MTPHKVPVAIIGAGPVGLYTALFLAKAGIEVTLYEARDKLIDFPRAIVVHTLVLEDFKKSGVYDDVIAKSYVNTFGGYYRKPGGEVIVHLPYQPGNPIVHCSQDTIQEIIYQHIIKHPNAKVVFNSRLDSLTQDADGVTLEFTRNGEPMRVEAQFVVGTDGGGSAVRKQLGLHLDGYTWKDNVRVAADIDLDMESIGWTPVCFVVDPVYFASVAKLGGGREGTRFDSGEAYVPEGQEWDEEEAKARVRHRMEKILGPKAKDAPIFRLAMYRAHQRCVSNFVVGRVALAGDAAHLNNPTGGLGLTSGILDAALLGRYLARIVGKGESYQKLLGDYADTRRDVFINYTDPTSTANRKRVLGNTPEDIANREQLFNQIRKGDFSFFENEQKAEVVLSSTRDME